ncbi:hypothetical protein N7499_012890 [Penicillium canescens]|nr:hypothetical protein N7499_012890 [Penicillium canescens]KAJ6154295.1 hypothetical protein N7485_012664 [Penicillium canescens]
MLNPRARHEPSGSTAGRGVRPGPRVHEGRPGCGLAFNSPGVCCLVEVCVARLDGGQGRELGGGVGIGEVGGEGVGSSAPVVFSTLPVETEDSDARSSLPSFFFWLCFARRTFSCNLLWRILFRWVDQPTKEGVEVSTGTSWERVSAAVDGSDEPGAMALVSELTGVASASA